MEANQILKSDLLDILFEGRNKEYGAYELRKTYNKRIKIALGSTVIILLLIFAGSVIADKLSSSKDVKVVQTKDLVMEAAPNEPPPPPPPPPPKLPPPPPIATIQFTPPKVVKDEEVIKPPPEVKQIEEAKVDVKTVEGTKDLGIVAPPVEDKGTQVVAAPVAKDEDADKVFTKVEIDAQFPGGPGAWQKYVTRAIQADIDEFTESDYGTCIVKFIVDKTGKVSQVEATTMKGTKLAEIATNAIRKGPNWTPAQQNGRYVNAYRLQPVTLTNPDQ
ncbi:energy transducer TonB [Ginsengibacter hankyongi]|uniref:Energy transducer TonB n=1 Tax=Ginsengibacter hankyongi TaxID=2607284 RepID=A0A5J5IIF8_9BACT|nr:energy transducer TonB [Ginsengibacter hankyongi]KAA9039122.1 energy transducer TonB [Ginsengibacter hankyongi]